MGLRIHPEKGVNPRMTICMKCGEDVGIVLLGIHEKVYVCRGCNIRHIGGKPKGGLCHCGSYDIVFDRDVDEHEKIPTETCNECQELQDTCNKEVEKGGIFWRCVDCGSKGALKAKSKLSQDVRAQMKIEPPAPCGIEFSKNKMCPVCSDSVENNNE